MNAIALFVLLLAIAVGENSKIDFNNMPLKKILALLAKVNDDDYIMEPRVNTAYQLMYDAATWWDARKGCALKHGKLATPETMYEFKVIQRLVRRMRSDEIRGATGAKNLAWVGISSLDDWTVWRTVDGDDIRATGFSMWERGSGNISPDPTDPHCAGVDAVNLLRDYWCDWKQPYVCEYTLMAEDSLDPTEE